MVGWHHQFNGDEFEQTPGDGEGQGSLACSFTGLQRVGYNLATEQQHHTHHHPASRWSELPHQGLDYGK